MAARGKKKLNDNLQKNIIYVTQWVSSLGIISAASAKPRNLLEMQNLKVLTPGATTSETR